MIAQATFDIKPTDEVIRHYISLVAEFSGLNAGSAEAKALITKISNDHAFQDVAHEMASVKMQGPAWVDGHCRAAAALAIVKKKDREAAEMRQVYTGTEFGLF